jgi:hypothetical protein
VSAAYEVIPYDIAALTNSVAMCAGTDPELVFSKGHFAEYFNRYLAPMGPKTMVVEQEYIDHDFLEDFAAYYVRFFHEYEHKCARFHFFSHGFDGSELDKLLKNDKSLLTADQLRQSYLGFVVIKSLPQTIVGRTCLRPYDENEQRHFPIKRKYTADLFGIDLEVETLSLQEQDSVIAACATSALWSAFQSADVHFAIVHTPGSRDGGFWLAKWASTAAVTKAMRLRSR